MNNLFYSEKDKTAFWISGNDFEFGKVTDIINYLESKTEKFTKTVKCKKEDVQTSVVVRSSQYENMRYFHAKTLDIPKECSIISKDYSMIDWLYN